MYRKIRKPWKLAGKSVWYFLHGTLYSPIFSDCMTLCYTICCTHREVKHISRPNLIELIQLNGNTSMNAWNRSFENCLAKWLELWCAEESVTRIIYRCSVCIILNYLIVASWAFWLCSPYFYSTMNLHSQDVCLHWLNSLLFANFVLVCDHWGF